MEGGQVLNHYEDEAEGKSAKTARLPFHVHLERLIVVRIYRNRGRRADEYTGQRDVSLSVDYGDGDWVTKKEYIMTPGLSRVTLGFTDLGTGTLDDNMCIEMHKGENENSWILRDTTCPANPQDIVVIAFKGK